MADSPPNPPHSAPEDSEMTKLFRAPAEQSTGPKRDSSTEDQPHDDATRSFVASSAQSDMTPPTSTFDPSQDRIDATQTFVPRDAEARDSHGGDDFRRAPAKIGPYQIVGVLGRGGMGIVYKAWHPTIKRFAAIKMILSGQFAGQNALERFHVEAQASAALDHPAIVKLYEIGQHDGLPFFALEYVDGMPLSAEVAGTPLEPERAARITARLADAMFHAHEQGILHRDIKPSNVLITAADEPRLTDFGLAKRFADDGATPLTRDGHAMGTPSYMPPEQARGDLAAIGPAADQYSLGALLYHLLTGRPPFVAPNPVEIVLQVLNQEPVAPRELQPSLPIDLETICLKALSKDATRRYSDCRSFQADLQRFLRHEPIQARPIGGAERLARWCKRNPRVAIPIFTTAASLIIALTVSLWAVSSLSMKNKDIEAKRKLAVDAERRERDQRTRADEKTLEATKNAEQAEKNAAEARQRTRDATKTVQRILQMVRTEFKPSEPRFEEIRRKILTVLNRELESLPNDPKDWDAPPVEFMRILEVQYLTATELGRWSEAAELVEKAEDIARERNREFRTDSTRFNLATILLYKARARQFARRDMRLVDETSHEASDLLEQILSDPRPVPPDPAKGSMARLEVLSAYLGASYRESLVQRKLGRIDEALKTIEKGLARFDEILDILRAQPNLRQLSEQDWEKRKEAFRAQISDHRQLRSLLLASVGKQAEARAEAEAIVEAARNSLAAAPAGDKVSSRERLVQALYLLGDIQNSVDEKEDALRSYTESMELAKQLYQEHPSLERRRNDINLTLLRQASLLRSSSPEEAKRASGNALTVAQAMAQADEQSPAKKIAVALAMPFAGDYVEAARIAESLLANHTPADIELQIDMARVFSGCAWAASDANKTLADQYRTRAVGLIGEAVAAGYRDATYLSSHPDFQSLVGDRKFQELLEKLGVAAERSGR